MLKRAEQAIHYVYSLSSRKKVREAEMRCSGMGDGRLGVNFTFDGVARHVTAHSDDRKVMFHIPSMPSWSALQTL